MRFGVGISVLTLKVVVGDGVEVGGSGEVGLLTGVAAGVGVRPGTVLVAVGPGVGVCTGGVPAPITMVSMANPGPEAGLGQTPGTKFPN